MTQALQTVTIGMSIDVTEKSRYNIDNVRFGYSPEGNFAAQSMLLAQGSSKSLDIPTNALMVLSNGSAIDVTITWTGSNAGTRTFRLNKCLLISDMSGVSAITVANNYVPPPNMPNLSESVKALLM